ncbi:Nuclear pore complex protein NUP98A [Quillaja saponaria]|uniref:Nucleoporin autopeptidase n=1 Tax=Quillaja saponaria TaxID=32244 RepID=A0AAD7L6L6_QUISA|nr:Nuclear pore complex protein NUP98A [Quillaja saponaria]KAJ7952224.1 Nuclear pore complex protein NUP98A [Quillaja saponaria]
MFGSANPFGQSSTSPFGSQSVFGQTNNASSNPFAPKPFGSSPPFGSQTGASMFGGTSTGVFGTAQSSSPFSSTTTFGASSSPAFGSSSTPAFGTTSSSFGASSAFGQKPVFVGFGSTPTQTGSFGSTAQPSQPAFGSSIFGSTTPFGASTQSAFGATSTPAFGASTTPAFGPASTPTFGATSTPAFGSTSSPTFGSTGTAFGVSTAPVFGTGASFGVSNAPAFGSSNTTAFGSSSTPAFGTSSSPAFGASSTPTFGSSSTPTFGYGASSGFGQSTPAFGSSPFGSNTTPFGAKSSPFGSQSTMFGSTVVGQSSFGSQRGGSRVAAYTPTTEADGGTTGQTGKLESISAMPIYKDKSHEELRWEDYQLGDKGGPLPTAQSTTNLVGFNTPTTQSNFFAPSAPIGQSSGSSLSSSVLSNPFAPKISTFGTSSTAAFSTSGLPASASSAAPSIFGQSTSASGPNFSTSLFSSSISQGTSSPFASSLNFGNAQSSQLFKSMAAFGQMSSPFAQNTTPALGQSSLFSMPSSGLGGNIFSGNASHNTSSFGQMTPSLSTPFQPAQTTSPFSFNNFGPTQTVVPNSYSAPGIISQSTFGPSSGTQSSSVAQPAPVITPFGILPAIPQISIGRAGTTPSVHYGISSIPVIDKPAPVRISSILTSRHLSQRRIRLPARKYHPKNDFLKVPLFIDDEETPSTPKADALFIPRENPRALVIRPMEQWPLKASVEKDSSLKDSYTPVPGHETPVENVLVMEQVQPVKDNQTSNGVNEDHSLHEGDLYMTLSGNRAGEAAIVYEHGADIEALMPKLRRSDYFTEPRIQELAAKERAQPGFCRHVKDFVVGRHGYGSIKFLSDTDVRRLDLESLLQFNNREVIVYMDDSKKPPVGQGLNKPAEVTLLNIKCFDKRTGHQYTEGPKIEKYREMLKRKTEDQGAEFVSYDPIKGEWKFRVNHFSEYRLADEDGWDTCTAPTS